MFFCGRIFFAKNYCLLNKKCRKILRVGELWHIWTVIFVQIFKVNSQCFRYIYIPVAVIMLTAISLYCVKIEYDKLLKGKRYTVDKVVEYIEEHFNAKLTELKVKAADKDFIDLNPETMLPEMLSTALILKSPSLKVYDSDGQVIISTSDKFAQDFDIRDTRDFSRVLGCKSWISNRIVFNNSIHAAFINLRAPIINSGKIVGIISAALNINEVDRVVEKYYSTNFPNEYMFIVDDKGQLVYHPRLNEIYPENTEYQQYANNFFQAKEGQLSLNLPGQDIKSLCIYETIPTTNWRVVMVVSQAEVCKSVAETVLLKITIACLLLGSLMLFLRARYQEEKIKRERDMMRMERLATVNQLVAGIAHEIRNPLTSIKGFLQIILAKGNDSASREYLEIVSGEIERIEKLANEFQMLARPLLPSAHKKLDLAKVIQDVVILMKSQAEVNLQTINYQYKPGIIILGDEAQLKQVWINLIRNALDAMGEQGTLDIDVKSSAETVEVTFKDNGIGIPEQLIGKLGTPFFTTKDSGTGLGLSVCYNIIDSHCGKINVTSRQGEGTTFNVILPAAEIIAADCDLKSKDSL